MCLTKPIDLRKLIFSQTDTLIDLSLTFKINILYYWVLLFVSHGNTASGSVQKVIMTFWLVSHTREATAHINCSYTQIIELDEG